MMRAIRLMTGLLLLASPVAAQAEVYDLSLLGSIFSVNAQLTTDLTNTATTITGSVTGTTTSYNITGLEPPGSLYFFNSVVGVIPDNIVNAAEPFVTNSGGLLFDANGTDGSFAFLLYSDPSYCGSGSCSYYLFTFSRDATDFNVGDPGSLTLTDLGSNPVPAVPETSTWLMLILGFASIGLWRHRQQLLRFEPLARSPAIYSVPWR